MFQPVGGMDRIAHAIYEQVRPAVRLGSPVTAIRRRGEGVRILHGPGEQAFDADYCICTLPLNLLQRIPSDFSPAKRAAIRDVPYLSSVKVAFEAPRFWEEEGIYGGLGWTDQAERESDLSVGRLAFGQGRAGHRLLRRAGPGTNHPQQFTAMSHEERFRICRESVERMHPGQVAPARQAGDRRLGA